MKKWQRQAIQVRFFSASVSSRNMVARNAAITVNQRKRLRGSLARK